MTCIVVLCTPTVVTAAADSLETGINAERWRRQEKLFRLGSNAICGFAGRGGIYAFTTQTELAKAFTETSTLAKAAAGFVEAMTIDYMKQLRDYLRDARDIVVAEAASSRLLPQVFYAGFEREAPFVCQINFQLIGDQPESWTLASQPFLLNTEPGINLFVLGEFEAAREEFDETPSDVLSTPLSVAVAMVEAQIKATPATVGPPVGRAQLDSTGLILWDVSI